MARDCASDDPMHTADRPSDGHGLRRHRIADTSILPAAPLRGPAATAVLAGELIAAAVRRGAG